MDDKCRHFEGGKIRTEVGCGKRLRAFKRRFQAGLHCYRPRGNQHFFADGMCEHAHAEKILEEAGEELRAVLTYALCHLVKNGLFGAVGVIARLQHKRHH